MYLIIGHSDAQDDPTQLSSVTSHLELIEENSDFTFNYDPSDLDKYYYSGDIYYSDINYSLEKLFYNSPYEFEVSGDLILIVLAQKEKYRLCGIVESSQGKDPLIGANVFVKFLNKGCITDQDGRFALEFEGYPNELIEISYVGYDTEVINLRTWNIEGCNNIISLDEGEFIEDGPVIKAYHLLPGVYEDEHGALNINYEGLSQTASNQEYDVLNTVQLLPGISSTDESASNLNIRGATPDQNLVLWEGAAIYDPGHMFGMISSINPFIVDNVNLQKGVYHPKYDNRIGGIVDVTLSDYIPYNVKAGVGTTMTEAHAFVNVPIIRNKLGIVLAGRHTINGLINSPTLISYSEKLYQNNSLDTAIPIDSTDDDSGSLFNFYDWNVKAKCKVSDKVFIKASYFDSHNDFTATSYLFDGELEFTDAIIADNKAFSAHSEVSWNKKLFTDFYITSSALVNAYVTSQSDEDEEAFDFEVSLSNSISDFNLGISNDWSINSESHLHFGYILEFKEVDYRIDEFSLDGLDINDGEEVKGKFHNLFGSYQFESDLFSLDLGGRSIYYSERRSLHFAPRIHANLIIDEGLNLKIGAGRFYQYIGQVQDFGEIPLISSNGLWRLYDAFDENVLESSKVTFGIIYNHKGWLVDIEGYLGESIGLSGSEMLSSANSFFDTNLNSEVKGIDFLIKKKWKKYQVWFNYTLSENEYYKRDFPEFRFAANNDRPHNLSIVNNWNSGNWSLSATFHYRSGLPYSEPLGIEQFLDENQNVYNELIYGEVNSKKLRDYSRWDVNASYRFDTCQNIKGEIGLSFLNIFNRRNVFSRTYQIGNIGESNSLEAFSINKNLLGFTPKFLVRLSF